MKNLNRFFFVVFIVSLLQGCGSSGGNIPFVNYDPLATTHLMNINTGCVIQEKWNNIYSTNHYTKSTCEQQNEILRADPSYRYTFYDNAQKSYGKAAESANRVRENDLRFRRGQSMGSSQEVTDGYLIDNSAGSRNREVAPRKPTHSGNCLPPLC